MLNAVGSLFVLGLNSLLFHRLPDALVQMGLWGLALTILLSLSTVFEGGPVLDAQAGDGAFRSHPRRLGPP